MGALSPSFGANPHFESLSATVAFWAIVVFGRFLLLVAAIMLAIHSYRRHLFALQQPIEQSEDTNANAQKSHHNKDKGEKKEFQHDCSTPLLPFDANKKNVAAEHVV